MKIKIGLLAAALLFLALLQPALAQSPVDNQLLVAMQVLQSTWNDCSPQKISESGCVTNLQKDGYRVTGTLTRQVHGGIESTGITLGGNLTPADAQFGFNIDQKSYGTFPAQTTPVPQFWRTETFDATPGQKGSGVVAASLSSDGSNAGAGGAMICGNLSAHFSLTLFPPLGGSADEALVDLARLELKGIMIQLGGAMAGKGACTGGAKPASTPTPTTPPATGLKLKVKVDFPDTVYAGDPITISGVVWTVDKDGWYHLPTQAKLHITQGNSNPVDTTSNSVGYFSVGFTPLDDRAPTISIEATPLNSGYQAGTGTFKINFKSRGGLTMTIATDKAVYAPGEPVTFFGTVTQDGKPFDTAISVLSDNFPQLSLFTSDGNYRGTVIPGQEKNRTIPFENGLHLITVKSGATGYDNDFQSVNYLVEQAATCASLPVQVTGATGTTYVHPIDDQNLPPARARAFVNSDTKLAQGTKLLTDPGARVSLHFAGEQGASATVAINDESTVEIQRYCKDPATGRIVVVLVIDGPGQVAINKTTNGNVFSNLDLAIVSKAARVTSVLTRYFVGVAEDGTTTIAALQDTVIVGMPDGSNSIQLPAVNRIVIHPGEKPDASKIAPLDGQIDPGLEGLLNGGSNVPQPNTNVTGMTIQAAQRQVIAGDLVLVPVWLVKANNVANINLKITYDPNVVKPEGALTKGDLLDNALFSVNINQAGNISSGFAQTSGLSGTGTVLNIPFRAIGKPGDRTPLNVTVTTINDPSGGVLQIDRISGEIWIYNKDGTLPQPPAGGGPGNPGNVGNPADPLPPPSMLPGDCDGDGSLTEVDALCALEMSVQIRPSETIMDVDKSGDVTSRDAVIILQRALGI